MKTKTQDTNPISEFISQLAAFEQTTKTPNLSNKARKKAFETLSPSLEVIKKFVHTAELIDYQLSPELKIQRNMLYCHIGFVYTLNREFTLGRKYLEKAKSTDLELQPYLFLIVLEERAGNPEATRIAREQLLKNACQPKHDREATKNYQEISSEGIELLKTYLSFTESSTYRGSTAVSSTQDTPVNFKKFFTKYSRFLGTDGYGLMINFYKDNPKLRELWRSRLFTFIKTTKPDNISNVRHFYLEQVNAYIAQDQFLKCYEFVQANLQRFKPVEFGVTARFLYKAQKLCPEVPQATVKSWFSLAAKTGDNRWVTKYLKILLKDRYYFNKDNALEILDMACELDESKGFAHFVYAELYKNGYADLQDYRESFKHLNIAKTFQFISAWTPLAYHYVHGWGTEINVPTALTLLEEAHELGSLDAGWSWVEVLLFSSTKQRDPDFKSKIPKALAMLEACESRSDYFKATIAKLRANCLLMQDCEGYKEVYSLSKKDSKSVLFAFNSSKKNPEAIKHLTFAAEHGSGQTQLEAINFLGFCYATGTGVALDLNQALAIFKMVLHRNTAGDNQCNTFFESLILMLCGVTLQALAEEETNVSTQRVLQLKALHYFQKVLEQEDDFPPMIKYFANKIYRQDHSKEYSSEMLLRHYSEQLQNISNDWREHGYLLKDLLKNPPLDLDTLKIITGHIREINEYLLDAPSLLPKLSQFVADYVVIPDNHHALLAIFDLVRHWHLASATAALEPLFMFLPLELANASFEQQCEALTIVTKCNFRPEVQDKHVPRMVQHIAANIQNIKPAPLQAVGASLFHTLALLDCNHPNPIYLELAKKLFAALKTNASQAGHVEISQLFHALHYFEAYYPNKTTWSYGAQLKQSFELYGASLAVRDDCVSNNQEKICELLKQILPEDQIRQEAFIEVAGRRVDFLLGKNVILQYNGTRFHNMWDDKAERAYDSLKEQLCHKTLTAPNTKQQYYVLRIDRQTWASKQTDEERLSYLKTRLDSVPLQLREDIDAPDRKVPFLDKMPKGVKAEALSPPPLSLGNCYAP